MQSRSVINIRDSAQAIAPDCRETFFLATIMKLGVELIPRAFPYFGLLKVVCSHMACLGAQFTSIANSRSTNIEVISLHR